MPGTSGIYCRRFGRVLALVFAFSAAGPALAEKRPHPCDGPPNRPVAELLPLAEAGDAEAQYRLGYKHRFGPDNSRQTQEIAASWFRRASRQGHIRATASLGVMHVQGSGIPKDIDKGLRLMRRAANQGDVCAQAGVGYYHMTGYFDVPYDFDKAAKWLGMAAEAEYSGAQRYLAELYSGRFGGDADYVESLRWAIITGTFDTSEQGRKILDRLRDSLKRHMSRKQIAEARRRAKAWLEDHRE